MCLLFCHVYIFSLQEPYLYMCSCCIVPFPTNLPLCTPIKGWTLLTGPNTGLLPQCFTATVLQNTLPSDIVKFCTPVRIQNKKKTISEVFLSHFSDLQTHSITPPPPPEQSWKLKKTQARKINEHLRDSWWKWWSSSKWFGVCFVRSYFLLYHFHLLFVCFLDAKNFSNQSVFIDPPWIVLLVHITLLGRKVSETKESKAHPYRIYRPVLHVPIIAHTFIYVGTFAGRDIKPRGRKKLKRSTGLWQKKSLGINLPWTYKCRFQRLNKCVCVCVRVCKNVGG